MLKTIKTNLFKYLLVLLVIIAVFTSGCNSEKSQIFFNVHPFSEETIVSNTNVFKPNQRIYYLITLPNPVKTQRLLVQIFKVGSNQRLGYEIVWGKQVKVRDEQFHYYTDYVVISQPGTYIMKVYSKDEPTKLLTNSEFYVKN